MSELFGHEPFWVVLLKSVLIFVVLVVYTLFNIWFERRVVAKMQHRIGPNVHGPFGLLQSLADGVKLALKEDIVVKAADKVVYVLAPILATIPAFLAWAVIPFGPEVTIPFTDTDDAAAAHRPAGRGALHPRRDLDRRLRHRARRLVVGLDLRPARRPALERADDLVRGRDGPVVRLGVHVRRLDVDVGDRRRRRTTCGTSCRCSRRSSSTSSRWSARPTAPRSTSPRPRASSSAASTPSTPR